MKFCPLMSTPERIVDCSDSCALFANNKQCAIKNLGNADMMVTNEMIHKDVDVLSDQVARIAGVLEREERME